MRRILTAFGSCNYTGFVALLFGNLCRNRCLKFRMSFPFDWNLRWILFLDFVMKVPLTHTKYAHVQFGRQPSQSCINNTYLVFLITRPLRLCFLSSALLSVWTLSPTVVDTASAFSTFSTLCTGVGVAAAFSAIFSTTGAVSASFSMGDGNDSMSASLGDGSDAAASSMTLSWLSCEIAQSKNRILNRVRVTTLEADCLFVYLPYCWSCLSPLIQLQHHYRWLLSQPVHLLYRIPLQHHHCHHKRSIHRLLYYLNWLQRFQMYCSRCCRMWHSICPMVSLISK